MVRSSAPNFWKRGLQLVWGDPNLVTDSDALRFGWPSIGMGWERGLLQFARAQQQHITAGGSSSDDPMTKTDAELFQQVLELPNTEVHIIVGSKDRVISPAMIQKFLQDVRQRNRSDDNVVSTTLPIPIVMDNLGHDVFEEDVDGFVNIVEQKANEFLSKVR